MDFVLAYEIICALSLSCSEILQLILDVCNLEDSTHPVLCSLYLQFSFEKLALPNSDSKCFGRDAHFQLQNTNLGGFCQFILSSWSLGDQGVQPELMKYAIIWGFSLSSVEIMKGDPHFSPKYSEARSWGLYLWKLLLLQGLLGRPSKDAWV